VLYLGFLICKMGQSGLTQRGREVEGQVSASLSLELTQPLVSCAFLGKLLPWSDPGVAFL
jgi:hypothetical protein